MCTLGLKKRHWRQNNLEVTRDCSGDTADVFPMGLDTGQSWWLCQCWGNLLYLLALISYTARRPRAALALMDLLVCCRHIWSFSQRVTTILVIVSNKAECFQELQLARKMRLCSRLIVCFLLKWEPDDGMKTGNDYRKLGGKMPGHKAKGSSRDKWPRAQDDVFIRINKLTNNKVDDGGYFSKQPTVGTKKHYHY